MEKNQDVQTWKNCVRKRRLTAIIATQRELAVRAKIPESTLSDIERNKTQLSLRTAIRLAEALGCPLDDLFERS